MAALVAANLRRHSRDRTGLFFMVVMPFVSILFVGMAFGGASSSRLPVGVVAAGSDAVTAALLTELRAHPDLEVRPMSAADDVRSGVRSGSLAAGLIIAPGAVRLDLVVTQANGSGLAARGAVDGAVAKVAAVQEATRAAMAAGATAERAAGYVRQAQAESGRVGVTGTATGSGGDPRGFAYTAPANLLLFTFINSMAVAAALVESRRLGMLQRALTAPVRRRSVLLGEAVSRLLVALAQAALIVVVSALVFGVSWGDPVGVAAVVGVFALVATGAAILTGTLLRSPDQAPAIGPPLGVVLGMLGGCLWPRESSPEVLNALGHLFPHAWGMDALLRLAEPGTGLGAVLPQLGVLAAMAALLLFTSLVLFSRRTPA